MSTHCLICKGRTEDIDPQVVGKMLKSKCGVCGRGKCKFNSKGGTLVAEGGRLANAGEYFQTPPSVETGITSKSSNGAEVVPRPTGGKLTKRSLLKNFDPLNPTLPQLPDLDFMQGNYPGTELSTGVGGNGFKPTQMITMPYNKKKPSGRSAPKKGRGVNETEPDDEGCASLNSRGPHLPSYAYPLATPQHQFRGSRARYGTVRGEATANVHGGLIQEAVDAIAPELIPVQQIFAHLYSPDTESQIDRFLGSGATQEGGDAGQDIKDFFNGFSYGFSHPDKAFQVLGKLITGHGFKRRGGNDFTDFFTNTIGNHVLHLDGSKFGTGMEGSEATQRGGDAGQDIKDFFSGFAYGFSHPDKAFQVIGKLITGHGISGLGLRNKKAFLDGVRLFGHTKLGHKAATEHLVRKYKTKRKGGNNPFQEGTVNEMYDLEGNGFEDDQFGPSMDQHAYGNQTEEPQSHVIMQKLGRGKRRGGGISYL